MIKGRFENNQELLMFEEKYKHIIELTDRSKTVYNELKRIWENDQIEAEFVRTFEKGKLIPDCPGLIPYKEEGEKVDTKKLERSLKRW